MLEAVRPGASVAGRSEAARRSAAVDGLGGEGQDAQALPGLDHLSIQEVRQEHPDRLVLALDVDPLAEVSSESVTVVLEAVRTADRDTTSLKPGDEFVDDRVSHGLGARSELDNRDELGLGIAHGPEPDILLGVFDFGPELIELDVNQVESGDEMVMEFAAVIAASGEPGAQGNFADFKRVSECVYVDATGQEGQ